MKGKMKQRVMAVILTLVMAISLIPANLVGGSVEVLAAESYKLYGTDMAVENDTGYTTEEAGQAITDYFTLVSSKGATKVDGNNKTFSVNGTSMDFTQRIKLYKNTTNPGKIAFTTTGAATITVAAMSGGSGYDIPYGVYDESGNVVGSLATAYQSLDAATAANGVGLMADTFTVDAAGTYYIYSLSGDKGLNVYYVEVAVSGASSAPVDHVLLGTDIAVENDTGYTTEESGQAITDYFTLVSSKGATKVDGNNKTFSVDGASMDFTQRIKLYKNTTNPGKIAFTTTGAATILVAAMSGGSGYDIPYGVYDESGNVVGSLATAYQSLDAATAANGVGLVADSFSVSAAGTYYIYSLSGDKGLNIYYVKVSEAGGAVSTITAPTVSSATATIDGAKVTVSGAGTAGSASSKYVLVRNDGTKDVEVSTADGSAATFTFTDTLKASGTYTYSVYGKGTTNTAPLAVATPVEYVLPLGTAEPTALGDNAKVVLSWGKIDEATSYDVKVYQGETELTDKAVTGLTAPGATIEGLTNGTEYGFVVVTNRNTTATDNQTVSAKVTATPKAPEAGVSWLNASLLDDFNSTSDNYVVNDNWTIVSGGKQITVESCDAVTANDGNVFTKRISTKGTGTTADRHIKLVITEDSYIIAYAKSSGSARPLIIANEAGEAVESLTAIGKDDPLVPTRAINLTAGTYYFYTTGGGGYIYAIKLGTGTAPRAAWDTVANPVINSVADNGDGTISVDFSANIGTDGADKGYVFMYQNGFEVASQEVAAEGVVKFRPTTEGDFTFKVVISREGEADKESEIATLTGYVLPLATPTITWLNNLGNGSVYVDWNNVEADSFDVYYRSEADVEFTEAATGLTEGDYTLTGLMDGAKYEVKVVAHKSGFPSSESVDTVTVGAAEQQWYVAAIGSATSGEILVNGASNKVSSSSGLTPVENVTNTDGKVVITAQDNGKIADSEDGIFYYFTKIDPNTENFKLTATFTVNDISKGPDNQSAYGIYATDIAGFGSKDAKYFNSVSVGQFKMFMAGYHQHGARLITGYTSYDASNNAGTTRNFDNTNVIGGINLEDTVNLGDTFTYTLEKTNESYICTYNGQEVVFEGTSSLMVQEDGSMCIGVASARKVGVEISNITFEKTEGSASDAAATILTPAVKVFSSNVSSSEDYEVIASANVEGIMAIYAGGWKNKIYEGWVSADEVVKAPATLWNPGGYNGITVAFYPALEVPNLESYAEILNEYDVLWQSWGEPGETIYVSPNGGGSASGTMEDPLELQAALNHAQPGQVIVMLDGTYTPVKDYVIPRSINGTADQPITLMALNTGKAVIDGTGMESSSSLLSVVGSYWHVFGLEVKNGLAKGISVCGNNNIIEMCSIHDVGNSGIQISRFSGEPNDKAMWPENNLIKNCDAFNCCDPGRNDADGFAAKLTCGGGNVFYGCISHHNIDDGWDLYAKSTTGPIGVVTIENCIAYSNGFLMDEDPMDPNTECGEGNGFKLGGENMPGAHKLINSFSYNNYAKGVTSNSGPDCEAHQCTVYNNSLKGGSYNVSMYTKSSNPKAWVLDGIISLATNGTTDAELGSSNGVIYSLRSATNYLFDGAQSTNTNGVVATEDWFVSTDVTLIPTRNADGTIDMHGLLELTSAGPADSGARLVTTGKAVSTQPSVTQTVSTKTTMSIVNFGPTSGVGAVNTGDSTPIMLLVMMMMFSAAYVVYSFRRKNA